MTATSNVRDKALVDVFRYQDYRQFLADYYAARKARGYSYRAFAKAAGLGAPNYLRLVIEGARNLSPQMVQRFADACGLGAEQADYFAALVSFNQAANREDQNAALERMKAFARYRKAHQLELAEAEYHSTWYIPAIRELVRCGRFRPDPEWIACVLRPSVRPVQVKRALQVLERLELIQLHPDGSVSQSQPIVTTGAESQGLFIRNYHAEMMKQATESMETVPRAERDISALTLSVGPKGLERIKRRLQELRRELLALSEEEAEPNQVIQLNLQLYPLTHPVRSKA